jgi:predicted esterase
MRPALTLALLLVGSVAFAQAERYELGARLKAFEAEWEKQTDKDARKRAMKDLPDATTQFLYMQHSKAAQTLDNARFALMSDKPPSDAVLWATSLYPEVKERLVKGKDVEVVVKHFYSVKVERPKDVSVRASFDGKTWTTAEVDKLPVKLSVPLPEGLVWPADLRLVMEVVAEDKPLSVRAVGVTPFSRVSRQFMEQRWKELAKVKDSTFETETCKSLLSLLRDLEDGTIPESDIPVAAIFHTLVDGLDGAILGPQTAGDLRVSIPTGEKGKTVTPCRLFVPEKLDAKKPVPLVVAMHGAGGSENMFFEGYGNGHIVKLCKERGWLLVSPRAGLGFGLTPAPPVGDIIDVLASRYPVDPKRVFIVGHSMGSSMAMNAVQQWPGKFAAVACLGGGGSVRKAETFAELPVFIGVGDKDFALKTAKALQASLEKANAKKVTFKEYPDVEHLVIVREALGDVFDLFDKVK